QWPGVMCIYGVTRIGQDSVGPSRFLPGLLRLLQATKPALVFLGGAWFILYLLNQRTRSAPLLNRLFVLLLPLGFLAAADAAAVLSASVLLLVEVASPTLLHLPYHHCAYDLIPRVPESMVAVTLFLAGCFFLGWACVARWLGRCPETEPLLPTTVRSLLRLS